jgi:hypothetical protein
MTSTTIPPAGASAEPGTTGSRRNQVVVAAVVLVLVIVGVVVWLTHGASDKVPYTDARSTGRLTLCSAGGTVITSGSTSKAPFVYRAVGSTATTASSQDRTATLYAYQPRPGTTSEDWSGVQLTAPASFTNAEHPMGAATAKDIPLKSFLIAFPPQWDDVVQIRLYLATARGAQTDAYDSTDLKISGGTWKQVGKPGTASCTDGRATSSENDPTAP